MTKIKQHAQGLASLGRGNDKMLVHMSHREVAGLQHLARSTGGSLTVNPHTGLPEAGWLESIIPMLAGAAAVALAPETGGASMALYGAAAGAAASAATAAVERKPITAGTLAGGALAGYGGAGLGAGLANMGAGTLASQGTAQAAQAAGQGVMAAAPTAAAPAAGNFAGAAAQNLGSAAGQGITSGAIQSGIQGAAPTMGQSMLAGAKGLGSMQGLSNLNTAMTAEGAAPYARQAAVMGPMMAGDSSGGGGNKGKTKPNYYVTQYNQGTWNPETMTMEGQSYDPGYWTRKNPYQSNVGDAYYIDPGYPGYPEGWSKKKHASGGLMPYPNYDSPMAGINDQASDGEVDPFTGEQQMARGGIAGLLRGPGDGMSDSIPATIHGPKPQRAALADGEFVISSDVVSGLGNGSTEAGSKHLYKMMDRVRRARTGKKKQAPAIKAHRMLPA